jgi:hypothetical protein
MMSFAIAPTSNPMSNIQMRLNISIPPSSIRHYLDGDENEQILLFLKVASERRGR